MKPMRQAFLFFFFSSITYVIMKIERSYIFQQFPRVSFRSLPRMSSYAECREGSKDECKVESPTHFPRQRYEYEVSKDIPKAVWMSIVKISVSVQVCFSYVCELKVVSPREKGTKFSNKFRN